MCLYVYSEVCIAFVWFGVIMIYKWQGRIMARITANSCFFGRLHVVSVSGGVGCRWLIDEDVIICVFFWHLKGRIQGHSCQKSVDRERVAERC